MTKRTPLIALAATIFLYPATGYADDALNYQTAQLNGYSLSAYQNEFGWRDASYDYSTPSVEHIAPATGTELAHIDDTAPVPTSNFKDDKDGDDYLDDILKNMPYSKQLKATWKVLDGETDLYVEGLRFDRGNKGVEYVTNKVPFVGEVDGIRFKAEAGEDSKVKFESSRIPFVGNVEGFKFKTSVGEESSVSVRYTTSLEKLGL